MNGLDLLGPDQRGLFIGGVWREAEGGERLDVIDPADGSVLTDVADGSVNDAVDALDAAVAAQADWAKTPPRERGEILRTAFGLITDRADQFAHLMSLEMGKTVAEARGEVGYGVEFFRWYAEEAVRIHGRWMQAPAGGSRLLTIKKPVGPCLFITPWNFPLAMGTRKIGPAIAAGCTMVVKPASQTPLTMLALAGVLDRGRAARRRAQRRHHQPAPASSARPSRPTTGCARSASPARPASARSWCASRPTSCSG